MRPADTFQLGFSAIAHQRLRSLLTALGIAVGIAAVILLTAIGEGVHRYVLGEFTQFGTHLIAITPGKTTSSGQPGAIIGNIQPLTLEDADALRRQPQVIHTVPVTQGNATVEFGQRNRGTMVYGAGHHAPKV